MQTNSTTSTARGIDMPLWARSYRSRRAPRTQYVFAPRRRPVLPSLLLTFANLALLAACLAGCTALRTTVASAHYVEADRATFDVVAPSYLRYVDADPLLSDRQKNNRRGLLKDWEFRIETAERTFAKIDLAQAEGR